MFSVSVFSFSKNKLNPNTPIVEKEKQRKHTRRRSKSTTAFMLGPGGQINQMANSKGRTVLKPRKNLLHSIKDKSAIKDSRGSTQRLELVGANTEGAKVVQVEDIKRKICVSDSSNVDNTVAEKKIRLDDAVSLGKVLEEHFRSAVVAKQPRQDQ